MVVSLFRVESVETVMNIRFHSNELLLAAQGRTCIREFLWVLYNRFNNNPWLSNFYEMDVVGT
jgi:hypothetical protein